MEISAIRYPSYFEILPIWNGYWIVLPVAPVRRILSWFDYFLNILLYNRQFLRYNQGCSTSVWTGPGPGPVSVSVQSVRFGLGPIPLGPIGRTGLDQLDRCSMRFTLNTLFKNDIMLHPGTISSMT